MSRIAARSVSLIAAAALALSLTACGSSADDGGSAASSSASPSPTASVSALPVSAAFGPAAWSVQGLVGKYGPHPVAVRGDRLVTTGREQDGLAIRAYGPDGAVAWETIVDVDLGGVTVRGDAVAYIEHRVTEGQGLDADVRGDYLVLVSLGDGSLIAETEIEEPMDGTFTSDGRIDTGYGSTPLAWTEEGEILPAPQWDEPAITVVDGVQIAWTDQGVVTEDGIELTRTVQPDPFSTQAPDTGGLPPERINASLFWSDDDLGLLIMRTADNTGLFAIDVHTGSTVWTTSCSGLGGDAETSAVSSDGTYRVVDNIVYSATAGQCYGGGEGEKGVRLTAVADDGTAYGRTTDMASPEAVTVSPLGEVAVTEMPDGATAPVGIMTGGLAVHFSSDAGLISVHPIK